MKPLLLLPFALVLSLLTGCATTESLRGRSDLLDFLADGRTTREEVLLKLGQPSAQFQHENILTYRLNIESKNHGYYVVGRGAPTEFGWSAWSGVKYSLVLVLDEAGVLRRHSLVEVN